MTLPEKDRDEKLTAFGEPLWVDALKTMGVALATLLAMLVIGGALGIMIVAPWGRASHDCSMYCVMERKVQGFFEDSGS